MDFRIADTFTHSLARLSSDEQKVAKTTAFDLQVNPARPSLQFHKLDKARDPRFASVRVSRDVRLIVHRTPRNLLLCYVGHHGEADDWAERRKLEAHPATGAAQLVEIREAVEEIKVPKFVEVETPRAKERLFIGVSDETLLGFGVPTEWLSDARSATEDSLFELVATTFGGVYIVVKNTGDYAAGIATGGSIELSFLNQYGGVVNGPKITLPAIDPGMTYRAYSYVPSYAKSVSAAIDCSGY